MHILLHLFSLVFGTKIEFATGKIVGQSESLHFSSLKCSKLLLYLLVLLHLTISKRIFLHENVWKEN